MAHHHHDDVPLDALGQPLTAHTHTHDGSTHTHVYADVPAWPPSRLHLRGTVLPEGEVRDVWVVDGVVASEPVADAVTVATDCWILPGLVDAHCHIGMGPNGATDAEDVERQALLDRDAGTLLARDTGVPTDTRWVDDREDLPRIIRAGRHIARPRRYIRNLAEEVEPEDLVEEVRTQARAGDGWVKLVGDWIDRDAGDLRPLWPADVAAAAIEAAHEEEARVTAHCFDERSVTELVDAGIDGIEHGTGLDDDTIATMAERGVALVPTLCNIETFPQIAAAGEEKFPTYATHMRALHARRFETIGKAVDAGVPVYAGTDAGTSIPHGLIAEEVELLGRVGGAEFALGAASWRAREWLGVDGLADGASADLVVYDADPRTDLSVVRHPRLVILRGRVVRS
ncbi:amidohydrolase family protein [Propioniciclava sp. MC1683]|uniref:amidohydrolase family protein n=1 Tax=Propioniciclava sp. MC1683 TaxID=2760309 RepID=UPI001602C18F|nr:amidohydrolase family protein [Propioniciclava sp. MC1683]MBB1501114.1 amidohydrolase family protein [Propioniciclava sp. MC1683]